MNIMLFWGVRCVIDLLKVGIRRSNPYCVVCDGELFWIFFKTILCLVLTLESTITI